MSLKKCEQCGEEVDQAKAFCPECGNPFVEEQEREESSEYESYAGTINVSKSMYKMMLSEMELDTSKSPEEEEKVKAPPKPESKPKPDIQAELKPQPKQNILQTPTPMQNNPADTSIGSGKLKWVILGFFGAGVFLALAAVILYLLFVFLT